MCVNHFPQKPLVIVLVSPELFLVIDLVGEENRLLIVIVLVSPHHYLRHLSTTGSSFEWSPE